MQTPRHIRLNGQYDGTVRFLSGIPVSPDQGSKPSSWVTVTRTGTFTDPRYGTFEISRQILLQMVSNFNKGVFGQDVMLDVAHKPENGAAAKILQLRVEGDRLRAQVEWTPYGLDAVTNKGYRYLSIEYHEQWKDNEKQENHGAVMLGAGLVTRPAIKRLDPIQLSADQDDGVPILLHPELQSTLLQEQKMKFAELLKKLSDSLKARKLAEPIIANLVAVATRSVELAADETAAKEILDRFEETGRQLSEVPAVAAAGAQPQAAAGLTQEDVLKLLNEALASQAKQQADAAAAAASNVRMLTEAIAAAEGLDDELKKSLTDAATGLLLPGMNEQQVKALATAQINNGNAIVAARKLSAMGFHVPGQVHNPHITLVLDDSKKLGELYHDHLSRTDPHREGKLRLKKETTPFVTKVLAEFDRLHGQEIAAELRMLADGTTGMGNVNLPVGFRREVIREALSDLRVLELVQTLTDFSATTTTLIPYEVRDMSQVTNDGIVYEGNPIPRAGITQDMDTAYILPMKLAMLITNEVMHFTKASLINWDAFARNIESNARILRELVCRRIMNALQRASDAYQSIAVNAESISSQLDGSSKSQIKTANFPIVRPHQDRDVRGTAIGAAKTPITISLNGTAISPYDGTGKQAAGTYYRVTNYNLGYIQFVDKNGTPVFPAATGSNTISYSYATNVKKVNLDVPAGSTIEVQLNQLVQAVGSRKAVMSGQRFVEPDFQLMSPVLNDMATNAEQFTTAGKRNGSDTSADGDLERIKNIPAFSTNVPGADMGDERILMGQRGLLGYVISKPYETTPPFEVVDGNGAPIGKKQAYGEEYSAIKVPDPVANRMTSIIAYSFTNR